MPYSAPQGTVMRADVTLHIWREKSPNTESRNLYRTIAQLPLPFLREEDKSFFFTINKCSLGEIPKCYNPLKCT